VEEGRRPLFISPTGWCSVPLMHARHLKYIVGPHEELSVQNGHLGVVKLFTVYGHGADAHAIIGQS
jgi:hypothetical protein